MVVGELALARLRRRAALLAPGTLLWTKDRALAGAARRLGVSF